MKRVIFQHNQLHRQFNTFGQSGLEKVHGAVNKWPTVIVQSINTDLRSAALILGSR